MGGEDPWKRTLEVVWLNDFASHLEEKSNHFSNFDDER
jgi:hypothetical protein